ncbi:BRO-N domain-containing protein [Clostridium cellulovorans]|jgi:prophage antirepressor-like protein|uniref:Prophage antirepressor n=1 Tax=Clostridium cellulovorans (strain ATCC 35296 / DSM 3052 / OCM 3 / 743B) TaxID=573061 RepID=D9SWH7_CLOC7|nr:BRO family protein [Clostridium cellulovorans]ADL53259.1 prophage antirepressor [Clostridium cellulovorans 743B]
MNELMIFEEKQVEVFEWNGQALFNTKHVAECLDIKNVNDSIRNFNEKQVIKLTNSDIGIADFRKLNNAGENFLTESGVYKLIFKSRKEEAERFQDWVTDVVLPSIRKTGSYNNQLASSNDIAILLESKLDAIVNDRMSKLEEKCKEYFKPVTKQKTDIVSYIKKRLGITKVNEEYELVKERVLIKLNADKWEDVPVEVLRDSLGIIDESIAVIKAERKENQVSIYDLNRRV